MFVFGRSLPQNLFSRLQYPPLHVFGEYPHIYLCYIVYSCSPHFSIAAPVILDKYCSCLFLVFVNIRSNVIFFALCSSSTNVCVSPHAFAVLCGVWYLLSLLWIWKQVCLCSSHDYYIIYIKTYSDIDTKSNGTAGSILQSFWLAHHLWVALQFQLS